MKARFILILVLAVIVMAIPAHAVKYVKWNATGPVHDGSNWCKAFLTIQEALDVAVDGEKVMVAGTPDTLDGNTEPGAIYAEKIVFKTAVTLEGGYRGNCSALPDLTRDPKTYLTIIDGGATASGTKTVIAKADGSLEGFTIRGAETAVYVDTGVNTVFAVENNIIQDGSAYGIHVLNCKPTIVGNIIDGRGTGVTGVRFQATSGCSGRYAWCNSCAGQMRANTVRGWTTYGLACYGVYQGCDWSSCTATCTPTISNNDISGGSESVYIRCCQPGITRNRITGTPGGTAAVSVSYCAPTIEGNTITALAANGVRCYSRSGCSGRYAWCETTDPLILDNLITDAASYGVLCLADGTAVCDWSSCSPVCSPTIRGNTILRSGTNAIRGDRGTPVVTSNYIEGSPGVGIYFSGFSGGSADGNWITGCYGGILVSGVTATITNNTIWGNQYEGIKCETGSAATITGNNISGGSAGIRCYGTSATHTSPKVYRNTVTGSGIGALLQMSDSDVKSNLFALCSDTGVNIQGGSAKVYNNSIARNTVYGINVESGAPQVFNNIVSGNDVGYLDVGATGILGNNDFWQNTTADYYPISKPLTDIAVDPDFLDVGMGEFHLQAGSPCIGAGDNTKVAAGDKDRDGEDRIQDTAVDIGCFEGSDDVITPIATIAQAKVASADTIVQLTGKASTASFPASFYVEEADRSAGICVYLPSHSVARDTLVTVVGRVETNLEGERLIRATGASADGSSGIEPLFMNSKALGGVDATVLSTVVYQLGVKDGFGLNNIGLLIGVTGKVTSVSSGSFAVSDGAGRAITVICPTGVTYPSVDDYVSVIGISSSVKIGGDMIGVIRARDAADIVVRERELPQE